MTWSFPLNNFGGFKCSHLWNIQKVKKGGGESWEKGDVVKVGNSKKSVVGHNSSHTHTKLAKRLKRDAFWRILKCFLLPILHETEVCLRRRRWNMDFCCLERHFFRFSFNSQHREFLNLHTIHYSRNIQQSTNCWWWLMIHRHSLYYKFCNSAHLHDRGI